MYSVMWKTTWCEGEAARQKTYEMPDDGNDH